MAWISHLAVIVTLLCFLGTSDTDSNGMQINAFEGIPSIREVSCSGEALSSDVSVFAIILYEDARQLAQVNIMAKECTTSGAFSSCLIHENNSRKTKLKTLIMDSGTQDHRRFFCEVTYLRSGERPNLLKWELKVQGLRLIARAFHGSQSIQEVLCSGEVMDPDTEVLSLVLLNLDSGKILASVKPSSKQCTTSDRFSACTIDERNRRRTSLSTLVLDLVESSLRRYGCEVTSSRSGGRSNIDVWSLDVSGVSLEARPFHNLPRIQEVECSGRTLDADVSVSSIVLFDARKHILATVNALTGECTAKDTFSSCMIDPKESRKTRLKTLVMDLAPGESREFVCEVTRFRSGERTRITEWALTVQGMCK